jgi:hypothetical protein
VTDDPGEADYSLDMVSNRQDRACNPTSSLGSYFHHFQHGR